ncbi:Hypothetical protein FKW44_013049, partial [Caligus rogercresseyi]
NFAKRSWINLYNSPASFEYTFLSAGARYAAFSLKIPSLEERGTWTSAGRIIKYSH